MELHSDSNSANILSEQAPVINRSEAALLPVTDFQQGISQTSDNINTLNQQIAPRSNLITSPNPTTAMANTNETSRNTDRGLNVQAVNDPNIASLQKEIEDLREKQIRLESKLNSLTNRVDTLELKSHDPI
jgi:predicted  nucleic acid-binding Zn-ribbon protein